MRAQKPRPDPNVTAAIDWLIAVAVAWLDATAASCPECEGHAEALREAPPTDALDAVERAHEAVSARIETAQRDAEAWSEAQTFARGALVVTTPRASAIALVGGRGQQARRARDLALIAASLTAWSDPARASRVAARLARATPIFP